MAPVISGSEVSGELHRDAVFGVGRYARMVGGGVRADRVGAVEIAEAAVEFGWTWAWADVADFAARVGWDSVSGSGGSAVEWQTGLGVAQPKAWVFGNADHVDGVIVTVADTDADDRDVGRSVAAAFHEVSVGLWSLWRRPTGSRVATKFGESWAFPNVVIGLTTSARSVDMWLISPAEQQRAADLEQRAESEFTESPSWQDYLHTVSTLIRTDPLAWTPLDMARVFTAVGLPCGGQDEHTDVWAAERGTELLTAVRTTDFERRFAYGDLRALHLRNTLPQQVIDTAFRSTLTACVQVLGTPSFVGGPPASATWRRPAVTITVSRDTDTRFGILDVQIEPTAARENETYYYCRWDDTWKPSERWRIRPEASTRRPDLRDMCYPHSPEATDWETFDDYLSTAFASLAADLPALAPYATSVVWVILAEGDEAFIAQGWFETTRARVETHEDGQIVFRDYPPGRSAAEQITAITTEALHAAADSPQQLRYYAFATPADQRLLDLHLGITATRDQG